MIPHEDRLVCVEWEDAWTQDGWHFTAEGHAATKHEVIVYSVGYVVQETPDGIMLSSAVNNEGFGSLWKIPNGMIRSVRRLKDGGKA